ncbi:30S ribosomal protein S19 [Candidatus Nesciobacter abundans]|uniref:Small ribosomal subunit protein uS19 n=1 Tax=Candidatus Nesciobacter abundans TaxID=2601668 RepID=A0A5C0UFN6_9PROT|nr:30S ribosomal protein S19 [Candidatus Nesciobacter abundans]QEK38905.1 30S ribosomal protein S19 [Candidatus Nesciobacter abundans]
MSLLTEEKKKIIQRRLSISLRDTVPVKPPFIKHCVIKKIESSISNNSKKPIKIWSRSSTIPPKAVGQTFLIHSGKKFVSFIPRESDVGHKFGEFAPTRTFTGHSGNKRSSK